MRAILRMALFRLTGSLLAARDGRLAKRIRKGESADAAADTHAHRHTCAHAHTGTRARAQKEIRKATRKDQTRRPHRETRSDRDTRHPVAAAAHSLYQHSTTRDQGEKRSRADEELGAGNTDIGKSYADYDWMSAGVSWSGGTISFKKQ
eukprot:3508601-Rhodomonas_salina.2